jgi:hypothetical protein
MLIHDLGRHPTRLRCDKRPEIAMTFGNSHVYKYHGKIKQHALEI